MHAQYKIFTGSYKKFLKICSLSSKSMQLANRAQRYLGQLNNKKSVKQKSADETTIFSWMD